MTVPLEYIDLFAEPSNNSSSFSHSHLIPALNHCNQVVQYLKHHVQKGPKILKLCLRVSHNSGIILSKIFIYYSQNVTRHEKKGLMYTKYTSLYYATELVYCLRYLSSVNFIKLPMKCCINGRNFIRLLRVSIKFFKFKIQKCDQILCAHKPYFLMPGHKLCRHNRRRPIYTRRTATTDCWQFKEIYQAILSSLTHAMALCTI